MIEQDEVMCDHESDGDLVLTSCGLAASEPIDKPTHCPGCGLRVREIDAEDGAK